MKKELIKLWNNYIEELIDERPADAQPSGSFEDIKDMYKGAVSFNQFMEWLETK